MNVLVKPDLPWDSSPSSLFQGLNPSLQNVKIETQKATVVIYTLYDVSENNTPYSDLCTPGGQRFL